MFHSTLHKCRFGPLLLAVAGAWLAAPQIQAATNVVVWDTTMDITMPYTQGNPAATSPPNWTSPVNYTAGTIHAHLEILTKPSNRVIYWRYQFFPILGNGWHIYSPPFGPVTATGTYDEEINFGQLGSSTGQSYDFANGSAVNMFSVYPDQGGTGIPAGTTDTYPMSIHLVLSLIPPGGTYEGGGGSTSITSPTSAALLSSPANINLTATAPAGSTKVEFYANGNLVGTDTNGADGWSFSWTNVAAGSYALTAISYVDTTASAPSVAVNITVRDSNVLYQINCGSLNTAVAPFSVDTYFTNGGVYTSGDTISTAGVTNPAPAAVYQTHRFNNFSYTLPSLTAGNAYLVRLHFAEVYWNAAGQRIFNVSINGQQVLANFDIFATAGGKDKALVREFTTTANASGQVAIVFTNVTDNALICGLELSTVANAAPVITTAASAVSTSTSLPGTAALSVTASDDGKPASPGALTYIWSIVSGPGTVTFGANNGTATGNNSTATFSLDGAYVLRVTVSDGALSTTSDASVTIINNQVATPTFSPPAGTYSATQYVTIQSTTSGAVIHYTTGNTAPTASSPTYSGTAITVSADMVIQAIAIKSGLVNSAPASASYTILLNQTITFAALPDKTFGNAPFTVSATSSSNLAVSFSVVSGPATISGNTVTLTGGGLVTIRASQAGDGRYNPALNVDRAFTVNRADQTITFAAPSGRAYGDPPGVIGATATSGLAVSFAILSGSATVSGNVVAITGVGVVTVQASQAGNGSYNPAMPVTQTFTVVKGDQTVTVGPLINRPFPGSSFTVEATTNSGLAVSFIVSGPATIDGNTVTLTGPGTVTVMAIQAGDANWNPVAGVSKTFDSRPAFALSRIAGAFKFNPAGKDKCQVSGTLPGLSSQALSDGSSFKISVAGVTMEFTRDAKGKLTNPLGRISLKARHSKKTAASAGLSFTVKLQGAFVAPWKAAGLIPPADTGKTPVKEVIFVDIDFGAAHNTADASVLLGSNAAIGGKFKKQ